MIPREVFERDRVLLQAERLRDFIDIVLSSRRRELRLTGRDILVHHDEVFSASELVSLRKRLDAALGEAGYDRSKSQDRSPESEAYIPRNPTLSHLQSIVANNLTVGAPLRLTREFDYPARRDEEIDLDADLDPVTAESAADRLDDALAGETRVIL